jgi:hypothetical protein
MNSFFANYTSKKATWSRLSDDLSRRTVLRTDNLPSRLLKNDFFEVDEAMIQGVERPYELILRNLSIEISDLDEVA